VKVALRITIATVFVATFVSVAQADNWGGVSPAEYKKNASIVYNAFASRYGSSVGREAVRCMNRESGGNRLAANYSDSNGGSFGLLQLNGAHHWRGESMSAFRARMWNVRTHLQAAVRLYAASVRVYGWGFKPWRGCP
jgi:hypothetical protein